MVAARDIERTFPGAPESVSLVTTKPDDLEQLAATAQKITGRREAEITRSEDAALITVPMPDESRCTTLRDELPEHVLVTGEAAAKLDFADRLRDDHAARDRVRARPRARPAARELPLAAARARGHRPEPARPSARPTAS